MEEKQIKSKDRVSEHGEVFTATREVEAMLNLVDIETRNIESTFLEPACGEGAFLIKVLERKLNAVGRLYSKSKPDYEKYSILALTTLYGIDIMEDNAMLCRNRLYENWNADYEKYCKDICRDEVREAAKYILKKNILVGNALSLKMVDNKQNDIDEPIIFAEWSLVSGDKIRRRDFRLDVILKAEDDFAQLKQQKKKAVVYSLDLHYDDINISDLYTTDPATKQIIPLPLKTYPLVNYWEIQKEM